MPATEKCYYNLKRLHIAFALSSFALLVATVWMLVLDHRDEWRVYQSTMDRLEAAKFSAQQQDAKVRIAGSANAYDERVQTLKQQLRAAQEELQSHDHQVSELRGRIAKLERQADLADRRVRDARAARDVARANLDLTIRDQRNERIIVAHRQQFDSKQDEVKKRELELESQQTALEEARLELRELTANGDELQSELKALTAEVNRLESARTKIEPESLLAAAKRDVMLWPILDGFNSPHKIVNDWLPDLQIKLGMTTTARIDRCRTCHLGIDRVEDGTTPAFPFGTATSLDPQAWIDADAYPHPFASHPRLDVYLTGHSPHPLTKFGCTVCHEGQGSGTSFRNAEHTADDPHQADTWRRQYDYHRNHFWEYPMSPARLRESSCLKCHHSVVELGVNAKYGATSPKVYKGWQLIRTYGCFGCHEISGYDAGRPIGPDLRLKQVSTGAGPEDNDVPGTLNRVGPSLRRLGQKTTAEWIARWIEEPRRFRPRTHMPHFYHRVNQHDETAERLTPVEIASAAHYLIAKSEPVQLLDYRDEARASGASGFQPDPDRGRDAFKRSGCMACHRHDDFPEITTEFSPELSTERLKLQSGEAGFRWLYTWIRNPASHAPGTTMPNPLIEPEGHGETYNDAAADITAWMLREAQPERQADPVDDETLDELVLLFLGKALGELKARVVLMSGTALSAQDASQPRRSTGEDLAVAKLAKSFGSQPKVSATSATVGMISSAARLSGDEAELTGKPLTREMKLSYVGRKTIARYGCFACHDIPGFETARSIGPALNDWGRKATSKLAFEHIAEYLKAHGEADGSSTRKRIEISLEKAAAGSFASDDEKASELRAAFFYSSLINEERPGFIWQKLREPRSYDYLKIETKEYADRLRMPKFSFDEEEIEAIATFVLGLVAEPPAAEYLYRPDGPAGDIMAGERVWQTFNCASCHILDLPEIRYGVDIEEVFGAGLQPGDHPESVELLRKLKPPRNGLTGETRLFDESGEKIEFPVASFRGLLYHFDPEEDPEFQEYAYDLWETLEVGDKTLFPGTRILVPASHLIARTPANGGVFAEWLVEELMKDVPAKDNRFLAWQMVPPPLHLEGAKVQTPWLYQYLKDPQRVRPSVVLRMPRFHLNDAETSALTNYFAARDGTSYPYQQVPQQDASYLATQESQFRRDHPGRPDDYLTECWSTLNGPLCIKCHSVGGRAAQAVDPTQDIRGLEPLQRLRPFAHRLGKRMAVQSPLDRTVRVNACPLPEQPGTISAVVRRQARGPNTGSAGRSHELSSAAGGKREIRTVRNCEHERPRRLVSYAFSIRVYLVQSAATLFVSVWWQR